MIIIIIIVQLLSLQRDIPEIRKRISRELKANKLMEITLKPTVCQYSEKAHSSKTLRKQSDTRDVGNAHSHPSTKPPSNVPMQWKDPKASLKQVLPPHEQYTYIIETYQESSESHEEAPQFSATIRINLAAK